MSDPLKELRTARKEGIQPLHRPTTSIRIPDRFNELRTARREGRSPPRPNISKKRDDVTRELHHVETYHDEGATELYPKGDSPLIDALRWRSRSSPPPQTRSPNPETRPSGTGMTKKTVRWADPLKQPTPEKIAWERKSRDSKTLKKDEEKAAEEEQKPRASRGNRASSIPRPMRSSSEPPASNSSCLSRRPTPIFTVKVNFATQARQSPQRPLSPLIPQAMPAPLRIAAIKAPARNNSDIIPLSASAPEVQVRQFR